MATLPAQDQSKSKQKPLTTVSTNKPPNSSVPLVVKPLVVNVFFDGTKNNMYNIDYYQRSTRDTQRKIDQNKEMESYRNAYSNVAHLFTQQYNENKDNIWVYVEGMGTEKYNNDDTRGFAAGSGKTGIVARASQAFSLIQERYKKFNDRNQKPSIIIFNVFGFSRGAATARHFVGMVKNFPHFFKGWGLSTAQMMFRFVGIFDTVSSFQPVWPSKPDFYNDNKELYLDFSSLNAHDKKNIKVFHIVAADEYREYFDLTDITLALKGKFGFEVTMNGAHSDIGGSYPDGMGDGYYITSNKLRDWFIEQGFYFEHEIVKRLSPNPMGQYAPFYQASRPAKDDVKKIQGIPFDYHKIPLKTMRLMAQKFALIQFKQTLVDYENKNLKGILKELINRHPAAVMSKVTWGGKLDLRLTNREQVRNLRHQFLHWSAKKFYGDVMEPFGQNIGYSIRLKNDLSYREVHHA
ncbi:phospholipase effector Tle1 domain-containing protein [Acinetobacter gerneri]|uniref:phospholipase effector Tle1 domain-containing protein n=1 Tax=Acinetobacter gerneri TaxID=202952 RepID=UPI0032136BB1